MTGSADRFGPNGEASGPDDPGTEADPVVRLARGPVEPLPIPEGAFGELRRRALRRRRRRAVVGATACVGVAAVGIYFAGVFSPRGPGEVVTTPATSAHSLSTPSPLRSTTPPAVPSPTATPSAAPPTGSPSGSSGPTASPSVGASGTPTPGGGAGGTPLCTADQLSPRLDRGNAGAGQIYTYLVVTNHSSTACHVTGFPGLSMLDASGHQIGIPATYTHLPFTPVVLAPGASASDTVHTVNRQSNDPTQCLPTSTSLRIYPPGSRASLVFPGQITDCLNTFEVTPFGPGTTGNPAN